MEYQEFKEELLEKVVKFYGGDARVDVKTMPANNRKCRDVLLIWLKDDKKVAPAIYLDCLFRDLSDGTRSMDEIAGDIVEMRASMEIPNTAKDFVPVVGDWEQAKQNVFPALIGTKENGKMLEQLVSTTYLDLSVIYMVKKSAGDSIMSVKVTKCLLNTYGVSRMELHKQALKNMEKEKYGFRDVLTVLDEGGWKEDANLVTDGLELKLGRMYVLTNQRRHMGAAGVLQEEMVRRTLGGVSCVVFPSSVHEMLFLPLEQNMELERLDEMVREVNHSVVVDSEVLSDHCYIYDGRNGVLKCA